MAEPDAEFSNDVSELDRLHEAQRALFTAKADLVKDLRASVKELESQVSLYKNAHSALLGTLSAKEDQITGFERTLAEMTATLNIKPQNVCAIAAIDGDGYPFALNYIQRGRLGGQEAATDLNSKLAADIGTEARLMVFVYLNKQGLVDTFMRNNLLRSSHIFDEFMQGFNQASPLFHMVDVGPGKEAADAKLRELCTYFARIPQTKNVYFAGAHDAGYATFLRSIRTDGFSEKFVLLRSSVPFAREMSALGLVELDVSDLFGGGDLGAAVKPFERAFTGGSQAVESSPNVVHKSQGGKTGDIDSRQITRAAFIAGHHCFNFHFLPTGCHHGRKCKFQHDSTISHRLEGMRNEGHIGPTQFFNNGKVGHLSNVSAASLGQGGLSQSEPSDNGLSDLSGSPSYSSLSLGNTTSPPPNLPPSVLIPKDAALKPPKSGQKVQDSTFFPMLKVLQARHARGEERVLMHQVGADLKALDPGYLGKNGVPKVFKDYVSLSKEAKVVWIDYGQGAKDTWMKVHRRITNAVLSRLDWS